jgi:hypothetical protein
MALTLTVGTTTLTLDGNLQWADELAWTAVVQTVTPLLTGVPLVEEWQRPGGRPITYRGGLPWVRLTRTELLALQTLLAAPKTVATLVHHDGRTLRVVPNRAGDGPISASLFPVIADSGPSNPSASAYYTLDALRLIEVPA